MSVCVFASRDRPVVSCPQQKAVHEVVAQIAPLTGAHRATAQRTAVTNEKPTRKSEIKGPNANNVCRPNSQLGNLLLRE